MAIAFDNATSGAFGANVASKTVSHTTGGGTDRILFVGVAMSGNVTTDIVTGITYNGVSMTKITSAAGIAGQTGAVTVYYLIAPATGANDVVVSFSPNNGGAIQIVSYSGAKQTGVPDSSNTLSTTGGGTDIDLATTTVADNCWVTMWGMCDGGTGLTAGTGTTIRGSVLSSVYAMGDSNSAVTPAGSKTLIFDNATANQTAVIVSFAPAVASGPTNLKTYNTNVKANIKTIDTNPIANVKTLNTNA